MQMWNDTTHFCDCYGVTCGRRRSRVTILNLRSLQLSGTLSAGIGNLSFLSELNLLNNSFSQGIPPKIAFLGRLRVLRLSNNSFSGTIPSNLSSCYQLSLISLGFNLLERRIPEELGMLSSLQVLNLDQNHLSGTIPSSLGNLTSLQVFSAPENYLDGKLPDALGQLKNLTFLSLSANMLSGTVPFSIFNLSSIKTFNFAHNFLNGSLPSELGNTLPNLQAFIIANNEFSGLIPASIANATSLEWLLVSINKLSGSVPSLEQLHRLQALSLSFNSLGRRGASNDLNFMFSLINCTNLWLLDINNNELGGVLPEQISNLSTSLARFSLNDNYISGNIPSGIFANLVNLERLDMWNNLLSGQIPFEICKLQKLKVLNLHENKLSGTIPSSMGNLTSLIELRLSNNNLQGNIPPTLGNCNSLLLLDLSNNSLSGTIPPQVIGLSSLSIFMDLSANKLTGSIPTEVGNLKNIGGLGISDNILSGKIPNTLGGCIKLEVLVLQNNFLDGPIPSSLSSLKGILELDLSANNFTGPIPDFLHNFTSLQSLNLSYNKFEGVVPGEEIFKNASAALLMGNDKLCGGILEFQLPNCNFKKPKRTMTRLLKIIISTVCALLVVALIFSILLFSLMRKKRKVCILDPFGNLLLNVSYQSLLRSTNGFASDNLIGSGSFGSVYKGILDDGHKVIAVKVLDLKHRGALQSFSAECKILKNIRHRNLVKVLTACSGTDYARNDFKALVYEFMANRSLQEWLHPIRRTEEEAEEPPKRLNLLQRLNIAIDIACALEYLHHHCGTPIVHCDLKPGNVLLDEEMNAHVGDFGLAKFLSGNTIESNSIGVRGTIGYASPEYGIGSAVSTFGDVYSYGILVLELFTGKSPVDEMFKDDQSLHKFCELGSDPAAQVFEVADPVLFFQDMNEEEDRNRTDNDGTRNQRIFECLVSVFRIGVACSTDLPGERMKINDVAIQLRLIRNKFVIRN